MHEWVKCGRDTVVYLIMFEAAIPHPVARMLCPNVSIFVRFQPGSCIADDIRVQHTGIANVGHGHLHLISTAARAWFDVK